MSDEDARVYQPEEGETATAEPPAQPDPAAAPEPPMPPELPAPAASPAVSGLPAPHEPPAPPPGPVPDPVSPPPPPPPLAAPQTGVYAPPHDVAGSAPKSRVVAGVLGILLGGLGVHKFYLGYTNEGIIMLAGNLLWVVGLGWVPNAVGLIEGIIYLIKSDAEFESLYVVGRRPWF